MNSFLFYELRCKIFIILKLPGELSYNPKRGCEETKTRFLTAPVFCLNKICTYCVSSVTFVDPSACSNPASSGCSRFSFV